MASDVDAERYDAFQKNFGEEDFLLLAYTGGPLFDDDALDVQLSVLEAIETLPSVSSVQSLPSLFRDQFGVESGAELESEIASSPFYDGAIIAPDRSMAGMIIGSRSNFTPRERREYVAAVREAAKPLREAGWTTHVVGPSAVNASLDAASEAESRRLLPLAVVSSTALLLVLLRSLRRVAAVATVSALSLIVALGFMGWLGLTMNMVTVALPPVLWMLSAAYAVHLLRYYDRALDDGLAPAAARDQALAWATRPNLLAALTTSMGFLALLSAAMKPVRELGLAAALGVPVAFVVTFGVCGLLLPWMPGSRTSRNVFRAEGRCPLDSAWHRLAHAPNSRSAKYIVTLAACGTLVCAFLATHLDIESNPLTFLDPDTPIVRDSAAVAEVFTGLYTLETVLELPNSWLNPVHWPAIERQAAALEVSEGVARVLSPLDYLKKLNQWSAGGESSPYCLPDNRATAEGLLEDIPVADRGPLRALVSPDGNTIRLSSLIRVMDGEALLRIVRASETALVEYGLDGYHTGVVLRLVRAQCALVETQLKSLALAVAVIFICITLGLRSRRLLLLSVAPNLAPIAVLFGLMALTGIPLDPATVMVAAMALGIAVDDTMHLLLTWRERMGESGDAHAAIHEAIRINGPAMATTSLMACTGFLTLGLSGFGPIRYFGLLSAAAMAAALAADLLLLPALIQLTTTEGTKTR
ncbi:MAG: MMPL family transporter [Candidatus Hydrogenedentes bacterium]|nr:MMPL family transporter [Candidatus Hydrogenedentota bacterium]